MHREELTQAIVDKIICFLRDTAKLPFACGENKLSFGQADMLVLLSQYPEGLCVKELAKKLNVTSGAVTQSTDLLVEKDLITREVNTKDHRALYIKLTGKAKNSFDTFKNNYCRVIEPAFSTLTDEELSQLDTLLQKLYKRNRT